MADPLQLPAPAWATDVAGEAVDGIVWRRVASIKPLAEGSWVGQPREETELAAERYDRIDRTAGGFALVEGELRLYAGADIWDLEQAWRLYEALGELLVLVDPDGGAR